MKVAAYVFIASGILIVSSAPAVSADAQSYEDIDWTELMPAEDLSALLNRPAFLDDIADGSAQDSLDNFQQRQLEDEQAQQYQAAMSSKNAGLFNSALKSSAGINSVQSMSS